VAYDYVGNKFLNKWIQVAWEFVEPPIQLVFQEAFRRVVQDGVPYNQIKIHVPNSKLLKIVDAVLEIKDTSLFKLLMACAKRQV
jgi:hypothetical protein